MIFFSYGKRFNANITKHNGDNVSDWSAAASKFIGAIQRNIIIKCLTTEYLIFYRKSQ